MAVSPMSDAEVAPTPAAPTPDAVCAPLSGEQAVPAPRPDAFRVDVLSDTHGYLPPAAFRACEGADLIVHAGDICGEEVLERLELQAPVIAVLGNNDWPGMYGRELHATERFERRGVTFKVTHIPSRLGALDVRIAICGHTHVPSVSSVGACTVVNPGSVSRPRSSSGPTMARIMLRDDFVESIRIVRLDELGD
ncbi:MAG: metallophosphoesterase family protein [Coriobacteriales bacterium]|jgi:putative phosphoesterase